MKTTKEIIEITKNIISNLDIEDITTMYIKYNNITQSKQLDYIKDYLMDTELVSEELLFFAISRMGDFEGINQVLFYKFGTNVTAFYDEMIEEEAQEWFKEFTTLQKCKLILNYTNKLQYQFNAIDEEIIQNIKMK